MFGKIIYDSRRENIVQLLRKHNVKSLGERKVSNFADITKIGRLSQAKKVSTC
jgi:hypothetical protein